MGFLTKIFGDANEKYLKKLQPIIEKINSLEKEFESFSDEELKGKTIEFKERLSPEGKPPHTIASGELRGGSASYGVRKRETLDDLLPEAFALVREASKRTLKQRHFDVQLIGGIILHQGKIAEMKTGEGKTLSATLPLYLNALEGKGCHLVTVNDYLARRDTVWMGQIYHALGLSVGCLNHEQSFLYDPDYKKPEEEKEKTRDELGSFYVVEDYLRPCPRKEAYLADITYGTNNEFGFDHLRDNMIYPVIRSKSPEATADSQANRTSNGVNDLSQRVQREFNYGILDEIDSILIDEARTPLIVSTPDMESSKWYREFAEIMPRLKEKEDYEINEKERVATLTESGVNKLEKILGMENIYEEKGIKYVHHLEQALRAHTLFKKDRDYVVKDGQIIIVDEFTGRLMPGRRWSAGLHQAIEAKERVKVQPESLTLASITFQNLFRMYKKLAGMTGTAATSAEEFEKVYKLEVIIVPTNKPMIRKDSADKIYKTETGKFKALVEEIKKRHKLGQPILVGTRSIEKNEYLGMLLTREGIPHQFLNAKHHQQEGQIIAQAGKLGQVTIATNMAGRGVDIILGGNPQDKEEAKKIIELEGLHVIGTERHEARRIDNQLRGRTGRQGDPGSSQFFVSLEDDLMRIFGGERIKSLMTTFKIPEEEAIEANLVSRAIEDAQSKIEGLNFDIRKHLLDYDDVMNKHRETFYRKRKEILNASPQELREKILEMFLKTGFKKENFEKKEKEIGENQFLEAGKLLSLRILDMFWIEHLENMEYLRDSVRLRAYGQKDPLIEYKNEGHKMFKKLLNAVELTIANTISGISLAPAKSLTQVPSPVLSPRGKEKPGRNDPCPCGKTDPKTGKPIKYKKCCYPKYG